MKRIAVFAVLLLMPVPVLAQVATPQPGAWICPFAPHAGQQFTCRPKSCDEAIADHDRTHHAGGGGAGGSGTSVSPPSSGLEGVARATGLFTFAGGGLGSFAKSNVTGENQWLTGSLAGAAVGIGVGVVANKSNLPTGAATVLMSAAGAAGGAAHGQYQKALGNEDTTKRDAAAGAILGAAVGFPIDVVNDNIKPFGFGRFARLMSRTRFMVNGRYAGVAVTW